MFTTTKAIDYKLVKAGQNLDLDETSASLEYH